MKHDHEKIGSLLDQSDIPAHLYVDEITEVVKGYSEYMDRWRGMDEMPEIGERIEVLERNEYGDPITYNMIFNNEMPDIARGWRPAPLGELPEVSDVA